MARRNVWGSEPEPARPLAEARESSRSIPVRSGGKSSCPHGERCAESLVL